MPPRLNNFISGLRLFLLLPYDPKRFQADSTSFVIGCVALIAISAIASYPAAEPPRHIYHFAFVVIAFNTVTLLLGAYIACLIFRRHDMLWAIASPWLYASLGFTIVFKIPVIYLNLFNIQSILDFKIFQGISWVWSFLVFFRIIDGLFPCHLLRFAIAAFIAAICFALPDRHTGYEMIWQTDYEKKSRAEKYERVPPLDSEAILERQYPLLDKALSSLAPERKGKIDLYFVGFAGDGAEDVFYKEVSKVKDVMEQIYRIKNHTLLLVNNASMHKPSVLQGWKESFLKTLDKKKPISEETPSYPLATVTNLDMALKRIGALINPKEDMVFLLLTSHGSENHTLSVGLSNLPLNQLGIPALKKSLDASGIRWKIIAISACYSGGAIDALKDDTTLIMTSARSDRTSFGCGNDSDMTYFSKAYFLYGVFQNPDFIEAFNIAAKRITMWEILLDHESLPQMYVGAQMKEKLQQYYRQQAFLNQPKAKPLKAN